MPKPTKTNATFLDNRTILVTSQTAAVEIPVREVGFDVTELNNGDPLGSYMDIPSALAYARRVVRGRK